MDVNLTVVSYAVAAVVLYYIVLFVVSLIHLERVPSVPAGAAPFIVVMIPARNEEEVIGPTVRSVLALPYDQFAVLVVNDGSTDRTGAIARSISDPRLAVIDRDPASAGKGKSAVLNHGFRVVEALTHEGQLLHAWGADRVVVGILDADGRLQTNTLETVAGYFADPGIASVQIGVQIGNARDNMLSRLQDMEFVAFTYFVQVARQWLGSSGLGGNGQFNRLSALRTLGPAPWAPASLTEDLDIGLRLIRAGWRTAFCDRCFVFQQGLTRWKPLMRQRTRWIQGHYQCWKHIPGLLVSPARLRTRIDLVAYLLMVVTVVVVSFELLCTLLALMGVVTVTNGFLGFLTPLGRRYAQVVFALAPISAFLFTYQRHSAARLRWWELPAFGAVFTAYSYVWIVATLRAWTRVAIGRWTWVKTPHAGAAVG